MIDDLTDDKLLNIPLGNLKPGELTRAFAVQVKHARKVEEDENVRVVTLAEHRQHEEDKQEEEHQTELHQREAQLLEGIREREYELNIEAERQDARAIKLGDGRRAYVDGDKYRDGDGQTLKGADRAQAEQGHLEHPDATTWQEHQHLQKDQAGMARMRRDLEAMENGQGDPSADRKLNTYEKQLQAARDADLTSKPNVPDYGNGDYSTELSGLTGTFHAATTAAGAPAPAAPVQAQNSAKPKSAALSPV